MGHWIENNEFKNPAKVHSGPENQKSFLTINSQSNFSYPSHLGLRPPILQCLTPHSQQASARFSGHTHSPSPYLYCSRGTFLCFKQVWTCFIMSTLTNSKYPQSRHPFQTSSSFYLHECSSNEQKFLEHLASPLPKIAEVCQVLSLGLA